jgi:hypothetical protein
MERHDESARKLREMVRERKDCTPEIIEMLRKYPLLNRISALCCSIVHEEPRAPESILVLIEVCRLLTKSLPPGQQTAVRWHLQNAIEELKATWN